MEDLDLTKLSTKKIVQRLLLWINDGITNNPLFQAYYEEAKKRMSI